MKREEELEFYKLDQEFETTAIPTDEIEQQLKARKLVGQRLAEEPFIEEGADYGEEQQLPYQRIREPIGDETMALDTALLMEEMLTGYEADADDVVDETPLDEDLDTFALEEEEDEEEEDEEEGDERAERGSWLDRIVILTGIVVLAFAVLTGAVFLNNRTQKRQLEAFREVGTQLQEISVIGESGILAVTGAVKARIENTEEEQPSEEEPEPVAPVQEERILVGMKLSSIQKDLKIKFVNRQTDKLIASIPFAVQIKGPDGSTTTKTDDDMDGIIYLSGIASGKYTVTMQPLEGYDKYELPASGTDVTVKDTIEYKKVDVVDEVKTEAEVNVAVEDTKKQETVVESVLTDTVEWVESTRKENTATYTEVKKSDVPDPATLARTGLRGLFLASKATGSKVETVETVSGNETVSSETTVETSLEIPDAVSVKQGESTTISITKNHVGDVSLSVSDSSIASVSKDGDNLTIKGLAKGETTLKVEADGLSVTCKITVTKDPVTISLDNKELTLKVDGSCTLKATVSGASTNTGVKWSSSDTSIVTVTDAGVVKGIKKGTATITAASAEDSTATATCKITVSDKLSITLDQTKLSLAKGKTATLKATVSNFNSDSGVIFESSDKNIATVTEAGVVTGVKEGKANITAKSKEDNNVTATCEVTVTSGLAIKLEPTSMSLYKGKTGELKVSVTGHSSTDKVTYKSSDGSIATVSDKGIVTGVAKGKTTITVTCEENKDVKATCEVTVKNSAEDDTSNRLKDKNGNALYYKDSNGAYHEAFYADYYKYDVFYLKIDTYLYTGWQTIDNTLYFFDKNGNKVTGDQIIQGAKYKFADSGALITGSGTLGIDVSKHNGSIDWAAVKNSGISYVIIRCGYRGSTTGALIEDPKFVTNIKGAQAAGLKVGIYFFTQAVNEIEAVEEASMVLSLIKPYAISYPVYLDVESSGGRADGISKEMRTAVCKAFCATIADSGYSTGIYANKTWLNEKINTAALSGYKIWLAQYAAAPTYTGSYHMWQYSSKGSVSGISGKVDMNLSYLGY